MTDRTKKTILIVNSVLCALAIPVGFMLMIGAVMGGAAAHGHETLGAIIVYLGMALPWVPALSIAGSWATMKWTRVSMAFVALPWIHIATLVGCAGLLFATA